MRRIYDFYCYPPKVGATIVMCPVGDDDDWAWFELAPGETPPEDADARYTEVYDGPYAAELVRPGRDLIREYFEIDQSDAVGVSLAHAIWQQMTAEQQAEARRLHREPCKGYDESCRPKPTK